MKASSGKFAMVYYKKLKEKDDFNPLPSEECNRFFKECKLKYVNKQDASNVFVLVRVGFIS